MWVIRGTIITHERRKVDSIDENAQRIRQRVGAEPGSEREGPFEWRQVGRRDKDFDRPRLAGHTANEAAPFEPNEHRVHRRRREVEESLQIGMAWRHTSPIGFNVLAM